MVYHQPALLTEAIEGLKIRPDGIYADVTFGGGGHSKEILKNLNKGKLIAFDQDRDAEKNATEIDDKRFIFLKQNFKFFKNNMRFYEAVPVSGIIADLGVSFHQFDTAERGFSFRFDSPLDMRMNKEREFTAFEIVNKYPVEKLRKIFRDFGEIENCNRLAYDIDVARKGEAIYTVKDLLSAIQNCIDKKKESQYLAQVFQALRIEVNDEIESLKEFLNQCLDVMETRGRLVIISYHSLEDRLVKNFFRSGNFEGEIQKDFFGNVIRPMEPVNHKVIVPTELEIKNNPRCRSAKLRVAEKNKSEIINQYNKIILEGRNN